MAGFGSAFDSRFRPHWTNYVLQSVLAAVAVFVALVALRRQNLVVAASLAATAFTVFAMPKSVPARTRNVAGGHLVGLTFGYLFAYLTPGSAMAQDAVYALAVGCSVLVMAITNTEHPPAAGTTLGVVIAGYSLRVVLGVIIGVTILVTIHRALKPYMRDLIADPDS